MQEEKKHYILIISSIILFVLFYFVFFVSPSLKGIKNYQRRVVIKEKEFKEFNNFIIEHRRYGGLTKQNLNLPLLNFLEGKIKELNIGKKAVYLRTPSNNENIIELSFVNLTTPEVIKFIYELEINSIQIKEFSLKDYELKGDWSIKMLLGEI